MMTTAITAAIDFTNALTTNTPAKNPILLVFIREYFLYKNGIARNIFVMLKTKGFRIVLLLFIVYRIFYKINNQKTIIAMFGIVAAIGLVAAVAFPSIIIPQQALAKEKHGNSFKHCHSFGPGHSNDACFK
jgi:hypothetical protein